TAGVVANALQSLVNDGSIATAAPSGEVNVYKYTNDEGSVFSFISQTPPNATSTPYSLEAIYTAICKGLSSPFGSGQQNKTSDPINYFNGSVDYQTTDLSSNALGRPFAQTRSWTNDPQWTGNQHNGTGIIDSSTPTIVPVSGNTTVAVVSSTSAIETFELVNG